MAMNAIKQTNKQGCSKPDPTVAQTFILRKPVSQSCAVAINRKFWQATGQSNLAGKMEDCSIGQTAVLRDQKQNFGRFCCSQLFDCTKFDCPMARQSFSLLATAHDCERLILQPE